MTSLPEEEPTTSAEEPATPEPAAEPADEGEEDTGEEEHQDQQAG